MTTIKPNLWRVGAILTIAACCSGPLAAQVTLDPAWRVTPDTSKSGFKWSYFQNNGNTGNSTGRAEAALAGFLTDSTGAPLPNLGDPTVVGPAITEAAPASPDNGLLYFEITNVINLNKVDQGTAGNFTPDDLEPGLSSTASTDGQAAEILTYITLPVGTITMCVNSDDGFQTSSGMNPSDAFGRVVLGEYSGGRGAAGLGAVPPGTLFTNIVTQAGTYPFRTIWENGGGDSNVEWFSVDYSGGTTNYTLINDIANGGYPAYRAALGGGPPFVKAVSPQPSPRQGEDVSRSVRVVLADGGTAVDTNSISLKIDGSAATISVQRIRQGSGTAVTVDTSAFTGLRLAAEIHSAVLTFRDVPGTFSHTNQWLFNNIENLILPATPVTGENFDSYPEATDPTTAAPPGWVLTNYTWLELGASGFGANGGAVWDLTAQANDPYVNWCMVDAVNTAGVLEAAILDNNQAQTINGVPVTGTAWMSGNCLFAASDSRARHCADASGDLPNDYAPQIQFAVSAAFNLSTVTNPVLTFSSGSRLSGNHEQNALEYSVDNGTNWLPGMILQNSATVFSKPDGSFDAMKMLTNVWADVARFPVVQDADRFFVSAGPLGQKFGDVLAVPITEALSPFIANRNDTALARRVEAIRLPEASRKSQVRLRFSHYGSCGWEWAVDNIAFYDVAPSAPPAAPTITSVTASGGVVTVNWSNGGVLQSSPSLTSPVWTSTGNSTGTFSEPAAGGQKFYRVSR